jgi:hypothetical protein
MGFSFFLTANAVSGALLQDKSQLMKAMDSIREVMEH